MEFSYTIRPDGVRPAPVRSDVEQHPTCQHGVEASFHAFKNLVSIFLEPTRKMTHTTKVYPRKYAAKGLVVMLDIEVKRPTGRETLTMTLTVDKAAIGTIRKSRDV